jgi:hypothetical protein
LHVNQHYKKMRLLFLLLIFLPSCEREYCWDCELHTGTRTPPFPWIYTSLQEVYCGRTEKEITQIIKEHEYSKGMSTKSYMTCIKEK